MSEDRQKTIAREVRQGKARIYLLTCITDGSVGQFVDEGPFPEMNGAPVPNWKSIPPSGGRQRLTQQITKRTAYGDSEETEVPTWAFAHRDRDGNIVPLRRGDDGKARDPKGAIVDVPPGVWSQLHSGFIPIPIVTAQWLLAHAEQLQLRNRNTQGGQELHRAKEEEVRKIAKEKGSQGRKAGQSEAAFVGDVAAVAMTEALNPEPRS